MNKKVDGRVKHGLYGIRLHRIWGAMKRRCNYEKYPEYHMYGGRGIKVCAEWEEFLPFYEWAINNGYNDNLTLDRIDVNGNYEPKNCRFITNKEQANNRRSNIIIEYQGEKKTLKEWAELLDLNYKAVWKRIKTGWTVEDAFTKPLKTQKNKK